MIQDIINASLMLRRVKNIEIHENDDVIMNIRPQLHVAIIAPFGSGKNKHVLNKIINALGDDCIRVGYPTRAAILGTITKEKRYNEGALIAGAGKVVLVNEFSEVGAEARSALLEPMEDGMLTKDISYHVKRAININKDYCKGKIEKGKINIRQIWFTCIAGMMYWPERIYNVDSSGMASSVNQKGMGLLSRFLPIPIGPEFEEVLDMLEGKQSLVFSEKGLKFTNDVIAYDNIRISQEEYEKYYRAFRKEADKSKAEFMPGEEGLLGRILNDMIRMSVAESARFSNLNGVQNEPVFDAALVRNSCFFRTFFDFFRLRRLNFTELKVLQYVAVHPNHSYQTMAEAICLTRRQVINCCNKLAIKLEFGGDEIGD
jgi:hypothetical protein